MRGADRGEQNNEEEMARYYKRRRLSYRRRRPFRRSRRRYGRRRMGKFRRGFLRRRINYRRGMLRNAKVTTQYFIHPTPGVTPVPSTVSHVITPSSVAGFVTLSQGYEYYKLRKVVITYWNPQCDVGSTIPGQYLNGVLIKYNNYNNSPIPVDYDTTINQSNARSYYLDGRNRTFAMKSYPKYMDCVKQNSLVFADALPRQSQWLSVASASNVPHRGTVTQWYGAVQLGLPIALANTGYLMYKYTLYFSFRQRKTDFLQ